MRRGRVSLLSLRHAKDILQPRAGERLEDSLVDLDGLRLARRVDVIDRVARGPPSDIVSLLPELRRDVRGTGRLRGERIAGHDDGLPGRRVDPDEPFVPTVVWLAASQHNVAVVDQRRWLGQPDTELERVAKALPVKGGLRNN